MFHFENDWSVPPGYKVNPQLTTMSSTAALFPTCREWRRLVVPVAGVENQHLGTSFFLVRSYGGWVQAHHSGKSFKKHGSVPRSQCLEWRETLVWNSSPQFLVDFCPQKEAKYIWDNATMPVRSNRFTQYIHGPLSLQHPWMYHSRSD